MLFRFSLIASLMAAASASLVPGSSIAADSKAGSKLLSKSRQLEGEDDFTWVSGYDIRYVGCHETTQFAGEEGGQQAEEGNPLYTQRLVHYYLCPSGTCTSSGTTKCTNGAEYIVSLREFVDAFTEAKMEAEEYACEMVRENCYCDNANDDQVCENQCFTDKGMDYCIEDEYEEEFEVQRYLECAEMENGNGYLFIGPYCGSDNKILLGVFDDETCTTRAEEGMYEKYNYGQELKFSKDSLVDDKCISCEQVDQDANNNNNNNNNNGNNNNNYEDPEVTELCAQMYEMSGKCESDLKDVNSYYFSPNTKACSFIHDTLPKLEKASSGGGGNGALIAFLVIFAVAAVGLGYYAFTLHKKLERSNVDLSAQDGSGDRYSSTMA